MKPLQRPCAWCREDMAARAARCPRCGEVQPLPDAGRRELLAWALGGAGLALGALAAAGRVLAGPLRAPVETAEMLHFLEIGVTACLLFLLALLLRRS